MCIRDRSRLAYSNYTSFFYPSVGLSAVVSNMFDAPKWLSFLKVRGSYTEVGNSYDRYMTKVYYKYDGESGSWSSSSTYPNLDLKPERTKSWEVGVNARFLNHINFDLTYYRSNTYNQTFYAKLPPASGYVDTPVQSGNILNQGIEMALGYNNESVSYTHLKKLTDDNMHTCKSDRNVLSAVEFNRVFASCRSRFEIVARRYVRNDACLLYTSRCV